MRREYKLIGNELHYKNVVFDDYVSSYESTWSQICQECVDKHNVPNNLLDDAGSGICGVKGCNNEADYYIDFHEEGEGGMYTRQLIIARKDLGMSPGKLAAQCCHASIAFLTNNMREIKDDVIEQSTCSDKSYEIPVIIDKEIYHNWICDIFTKTICEAKNRTQLLKAVTLAEELGLEENKDFFLIKDACLTELEPEEFDDYGVGRVLTCIGFKPLPDEIVQQISHKYQLYR